MKLLIVSFACLFSLCGAEGQTSQSAIACDGKTPQPAWHPCRRVLLSDQELKTRDEEQRRRFEPARKLLLRAGVPFEPNELLITGWPGRMRRTLDTMPKMHDMRREKSLAGVYFADTLYLPPRARVTKDTVVLVNHVVFEGRRPSVSGPYQIYFIPILSVTCLPTTLEHSLQRGGVTNWKGPGLPGYSVIKDLDLNVDCGGIGIGTDPHSSNAPSLPRPVDSIEPGLPQFPPDPVPIQKPPQ